MKKQWFTGLAVVLGMIGSNVFGQYNGYNGGQFPGSQPYGSPTAGGQYFNGQNVGGTVQGQPPQVVQYQGGQYQGGQYQGGQYPPAQNQPSPYQTPSNQGLSVSAGVQPGGQEAGNQQMGSSYAGYSYATPQLAGNQFPNTQNVYGQSSYPVATQSILQSVPQVPSAFSVQRPTAAPTQSETAFSGQYFATAPGNQYQLVTAQNQSSGQLGAGAEAVPPPVHYPNSAQVSQPAPVTPQSGAAAPTASAGVYHPGCQSCAPGGPSYFGPSTVPAYSSQAANIAPNCATTGSTPISSAFAKLGHRRLFSGMPAAARPWFGGASFVLFNRVDCNDTPLSFFDTSYTGNVLTTGDARMQAAPGVELNVGRYFNCGRNAIQFNYWGIYPSTENATRARTTAGDYRSRIPFTYMTMPGTPTAPTTPYAVYDWYDNAFTHALTRSSEYYSFEMNLLGFAAGGAARNFNSATKNIFSGHGCGSCGGSGCTDCAAAGGSSCNTCPPTKFATGPCCLTPPACGSRLNLTWLAGFRYFRFEDNLLYAASLADAVVNRGTDDLYYEVNTTNELAGCQVGGRLDCCVHRRINVYGSANVGVYNNHSTLYSRLGTDFNFAYLNDTRAPANPNNGQNYVFNEMKDEVAFLSEFGTGFGYRFCNCATLTAGYRAIVASGIASAPANLQTAFANYTDIRDFDNRGTLILHGFNVGATYNF